MLTLGFAMFGVALWTTLVPVGAGLAVASLVIGSSVIYGRWRRRLRRASREEDLPWQALLSLLAKRNRDREAAGLPPEEVTEEVLDQLLARLPSVPSPGPVDLPEDHEFRSVGGDNRRSSRRRWGNPTLVLLRSYLWAGHLRGLVVNRSTGGLGIFTDKEVPADTSLQIRAAEAPLTVREVWADVRHCRRVGRGFFFGCEFSEDLPWNVRVWFG
jgi:hypothetical protein